MTVTYSHMLDHIYAGDYKTISRAISLIENNAPGHETLLATDPAFHPPIIGITGPPGAGKSTITDKLIGELQKDGSTVAVLCVDPSSPFTHGAFLGDRIRMSEWYVHPSVFIRSLATRGSLGGIPAYAKKIIRLLSSAPFDYIIVETVGVGQSEVDIVSLANCTIVVLVPESGDDIQIMKAGIMEIADIFVVNKCDRPGSDHFANDIRAMLKSSPYGANKSVIKTIANTRQGIGDLVSAIKNFLESKQ